jgi:thiamine kinase-like enzyme
MVAALPGNIRLRLEQTLAQWRHWDCDPALPAAPRIVSVLTPGLSNVSVLVEAGHRFVVRIDGIDPAAHSINRQGEWHSLAAACRAGLAPRPRYFNPELGSLVCDYLEPDDRQPLAIADIARLLHGIHQLPPRHHRLDLAERLLGYEKHLAQRDPARATELAPYRTAVRGVLASASEVACPAVLCHHDLLRANRLYSGGRLLALDWEYSAMGNPWYDLAVVIAGDSLAAVEADRLLQAYLGRPASTGEYRLVLQLGCVYRYLELVWYLVQDHPSLDAALLQEKLDLLGENLRAAR